MSKKHTIKLTESDLKKVIAESVKTILRESNGKAKLRNSFKSKEDATEYRDQYDSRGENDREYGPYMPYSSTVCDDGYDYCGDDLYNDEASDYNSRLKKRLATKGGQMSYDWDSEYGREKSKAEIYRQQLDADADEAYLRGIRDDYASKRMRDKWIDGKIDTEQYLEYPDYIDNRLNKQFLGSTPLRNQEVKKQGGHPTFRNKGKMNRKTAADNYKKLFNK